MYAYVRLLNGWSEKLIYKIPQSFPIEGLEGGLVIVPLQKRTEMAVIEKLLNSLPHEITYNVKEILKFDPILNHPAYKKFIVNLSSYYAIEPIDLIKRFCSFLETKSEQQVSEFYQSKPIAEKIILTDEQRFIVEDIQPQLSNPAYKPSVIHGVTGSGKTEVYACLISRALELQKTVLLLLPEVSLAVQFTRFFKNRLGADAPIFDFHSASGIPNKKALWSHIKSGRAALIIGVHLPALLPIDNLGLIIIDEEHEIGFQEKKYPKINTKEAALLRAASYNIPIVLGSATPSISTLYNVFHKNWKLYTIKKRYAGAFPKIQLVHLTKEKRDNFWISKELEDAIRDRLAKKEQTILFLNRRGHSFFIQCLGCGHTFSCHSCSVSLTYHDDDSLCCHYCGFKDKAPSICPGCKSSKLLKKGIGTQQVIKILEKLFPAAKLGRADRDTTVNHKKWQKTLGDFYNGDLDLLVGTQTITKGYHFPKVTLVGILWADIHLGLPCYNAAESTVQQLIQVAGRAGRQQPDSLVIVQTMLPNKIFEHLSEENYLAFYEYEVNQRVAICYPPHIRFAEIELRHDSEKTVEREANNCADAMLDLAEMNKSACTILGPAQPPVYKIKNVFIRKIYIKGDSIKELLSLYAHAQKTCKESSIFFTPNPLTI